LTVSNSRPRDTIGRLEEDHILEADRKQLEDHIWRQMEYTWRQLENEFWETNGNCGRQLEDNFETTSGREVEAN
jgi:hypothetical protein